MTFANTFLIVYSRDFKTEDMQQEAIEVGMEFGAIFAHATRE